MRQIQVEYVVEAIEEVEDSKNILNMKLNIKYLLLLIGVAMQSALSYGNVQVESDSIWIRPVKKDTITNVKDHGKVYRLFKGSFVQVKGEKDGDIIIANDTLRTDASVYTDYNGERKIAKTEGAKYYQIKDNITILNDSVLIFSFEHLEAKGSLRLYINSNNKVQKELSYGVNDTVPLNTIGIALGEIERIVLVKDSALALYIPYKDINREFSTIDDGKDTDTNSQKAGLPLWAIISIAFLGIVVATILILFFMLSPNIRKKMQKENSRLLIKEKEQAIIQHDCEFQDERDNILALKVQLQDVKNKLNAEKSDRDKIIKTKIREIEEECRQKIYKAELAANKKIEIANDNTRRAEQKTKTISDELNAKFDVERKGLIDKQNKLKKELEETNVLFSKTKQLLQETENSLVQANRQVQNLTSETESFHKNLSGAVESMPYCKSIVTLIDLSNRILESATCLLQSNIEDKYFVYKPLALYIAKLNSLNLSNFHTDVEMISKTGFVIKGTPLASYDSKLSKDELATMTRNYFFTNYLKTYIDAIVVLNESLAGLPYLVDDAKSSEVCVFEQYRQELEDTARMLGINILTVKVYDSVGVNTDLLAVEVDAGIEKHGAILEIENCKVSLIGGAPNNERIKVKIQK